MAVLPITTRRQPGIVIVTTNAIETITTTAISTATVTIDEIAITIATAQVAAPRTLEKVYHLAMTTL